MHSEPPCTRPLFLPAVTLPHNTIPHQTTQNSPRIRGLHVTGQSFCLRLHDHTTQHSTTQSNTFRAFFEHIQGLHIQGPSFCLQLHYHTTQFKTTHSFECIQGLRVQGPSFCLQLHYHSTQHHTTQLKTTHSLNAFRASAYKAFLPAVTQPHNIMQLKTTLRASTSKACRSACSGTTT